MSHPSLRAGFTAAFSAEEAGRERLVIVAEVVYASTPASKAARRIPCDSAPAVADATGIVPDEIVLVRQRSIPRTSSGKIQRHACKTAFATDSLDVVSRWRAPGSDTPRTTDTILAFVLDWLGEELLLDTALLDSRSTLRDLGIDSLAAARLLVAIEGRLGYRIDAGELWSQPSIGALANHLASLVSTHGATIEQRGQPTRLEQTYGASRGPQLPIFRNGKNIVPCEAGSMRSMTSACSVLSSACTTESPAPPPRFRGAASSVSPAITTSVFRVTPTSLAPRGMPSPAGAARRPRAAWFPASVKSIANWNRSSPDSSARPMQSRTLAVTQRTSAQSRISSIAMT